MNMDRLRERVAWMQAGRDVPCCGPESRSELVTVAKFCRDGAVVIVGVPAERCPLRGRVFADVFLGAELEEVADTLEPGVVRLADLLSKDP